MSSVMLPDGWEMLQLKEIVARTKTLNPASHAAEIFDLYSVPSYSSGVPEERAGREIGSTKQLIHANDVLLCKIVPHINRVWVVSNQGAKRKIASSEWIVYRDHFCDPNYLRYYFSSSIFRREFLQTIAGVGGSLMRARPAAVGELSVPIAPIEEQRRIVGKLDQLMAIAAVARRELESVGELIKQYRKDTLDAATSGELTKEWSLANKLGPWRDVYLADLAEVQSGIMKDAKKQSLDDEELPYLRVANVQRGFFDLRQIKTIRVPSSRVESLLLRTGDILFNEGGDIDKLGRGWVWEEQVKRCTFQNHIFRARLLDNKNHPKYISIWANHRGVDYFLRAGKQTTNLASINKKMLIALPISLPPPEEQAEIVRRVEQAFSFISKIESDQTAALDLLAKLEEEFLAKAFSGTLLPQDPHDEPASRLITLLRANKLKSISARSAETELRRKRAPRRKSIMNKSRHDPDVLHQPYLAQRLREAGGGATVTVLFERCDLSISDFYKQLSWEVKAGHVRDLGAEFEAT